MQHWSPYQRLQNAALPALIARFPFSNVFHTLSVADLEKCRSSCSLLTDGKDLSKISGNQVHPISQALCWQRAMTDVLYLK